MPPLVYLAPGAARQAGRLAPGVVVENLVAEAIAHGEVAAGGLGGIVFLDAAGLVARVERQPGRLRPRPRLWLVTELEAHWDTIEGGNANGNARR